MADLVAADRAAGDEQVVDALGKHCPVGHLEIATGGRQDQNAVPVDELGEDADAVVEPALATDIIVGHVVNRVDLAGFTDADAHPKVANFGTLTTGRELGECSGGHHCLSPPLNLCDGQALDIGPVDVGKMDEVEIGQVALVRDCTPRAADRGQIGRDGTGFSGLFEWLA